MVTWLRLYGYVATTVPYYLGYHGYIANYSTLPFGYHGYVATTEPWFAMVT